jgi:hypothetical protein
MYVRRDRSGDQRLPVVGVVVVKALERTPFYSRPRTGDRREKVVPADLAIVHRIHAGGLELSDRRLRLRVEHRVELLVADLVAIAAMQRSTELLRSRVIADLRICADHTRLHIATFASPRGSRPAPSTTRPTASGHSIA